MHAPQEGDDMDSRDTVRERFAALEQRTEHLKHQTQVLEAQGIHLKRDIS